jgi:hypothetical protein
VTARLLRAQLDGYLQRVVEHDVEESGLRVRRPDTLRRWLTAYAAAIATTASYEKIRDGARAVSATSRPGRRQVPTPRSWNVCGSSIGSTRGHPHAHRCRGFRTSKASPRRSGTVGQAARCRRRCAARRTRAQLARIAGDDDAGQFPWLRDQLGEDLLDAAIITTGPDATGDPTASPSCPPQSSGRSPARSIRPRYGSSSRPRRFETDHRTTSQCGAARRPRPSGPIDGPGGDRDGADHARVVVRQPPAPVIGPDDPGDRNRASTSAQVTTRTGRSRSRPCPQ